MNWSKSILYKSGRESTRDLHVLNVYADLDFIADLAYLAINGDSYDKTFLQAYGSKKYQDGRENSDVKSINDVTLKYNITLDELIYFGVGRIEGMPLPRERPFKVNWDEYDNDEWFTVKFKLDINYDEFKEIWDLIKAKKKTAFTGRKPRKRKSVENDKLIYAIFKARRTGKKFKTIFENYSNGKLAYYAGSNKQFSTQDSLERYYRKYAPVQQQE